MKKILIVVLLMVIPLSLFAMNDILIGLDGGFHWMHTSGDGTEGNLYSPSAGFSMFTFIENSNWGVKASFSFFFPQSGDITLAGQTYDFSKDDIFDIIFGFDTMIGASYNIIKDDALFVPISLGIHYNLLSMNLIGKLGSALSYSFGAAASVSVIKVFSERFYVMADMMLVYDFYQFNSYELVGNQTSESGSITQFIFNPKIGVGVKFKSWK